MSGKIVICPRCGEENLSWAGTCKKCHGSLGPGTSASSPPLPTTLAIRRSKSAAGIIIAVLSLIGGGIASYDLISTEREARVILESLSAPQLTQLYTQASFWMLGVIASLLFGILLVLSIRD